MLTHVCLNMYWFLSFSFCLFDNLYNYSLSHLCSLFVSCASYLFRRCRYVVMLLCCDFVEMTLNHLLQSFLAGGRHSYRYLGVYRAPPFKYLGRPIRIKNPRYSKRICQRIARQGRYQVFAIRGDRQCFVSRSSPRKFTIYGRSNSRKPGKTIKVYVRPKGKFKQLYYKISNIPD